MYIKVPVPLINCKKCDLLKELYVKGDGTYQYCQAFEKVLQPSRFLHIISKCEDCRNAEVEEKETKKKYIKIEVPDSNCRECTYLEELDTLDGTYLYCSIFKSMLEIKSGCFYELCRCKECNNAEVNE